VNSETAVAVPALSPAEHWIRTEGFRLADPDLVDRLHDVFGIENGDLPRLLEAAAEARDPEPEVTIAQPTRPAEADEPGREAKPASEPETKPRPPAADPQRPAATGRLLVESWREFEGSAHDDVPCLVDGLWPERALGFIAAPPKKGKTWVALSIALSIATGEPLFGVYNVPEPRHVVYVALEGHRAALRARIGCLARGLDVDPDGDGLDRLHLIYRPAGINLADPTWALELRDLVADVEAALVVVDVLRAAAAIKENAAEDFALLRGNLAPLIDAGCSPALVHHFGKLTEISKDRTPGERMTGSGAMYGALDVGVFITGSDDGAKKLRLEFDGRDLAYPEPIGLSLAGDGTGPNGGFSYRDTVTAAIDDPPARDNLKAPAEIIATWIRSRPGCQARPGEIQDALDISEGTLRSRREALAELGVAYISAGRDSIYHWLSDPAPANPQPLRGDPLRGHESHKQAESTPQPADPADPPTTGSGNP
jgi:hypothetical protein